MIKNLMHSRISKILIVGFIVMVVAGCDSSFLDPHNKEGWWLYSDVKHIRKEYLLEELLKEAQETNAMLQQIVQRLEVENEDI